jgi:Na+/H+ antiporter NhaD/arsenite permease-like protein
MKTKPLHTLQTLHYLSLDVVTGAILSSIMFWKMPDGNSQPDALVLVVLGVCTWIVYIFDRLLDNIKSEPQDARHHFHFDNQYYLQVTIIVLAVLAFFLVFFMPKPVIIFGVTFSVFLFLYFRILQKKTSTAAYHEYKEIATALLYSVPVFGSAFVGREIGFWQYLSAFNFILLVHQSILVFSWYELQEKHEVRNFARKLGEKRVRLIVISSTVFIGICLLTTIEGYMKEVFLIELLMAGSTLAIFLFPKKLSVNQHYRWLGEMVFWLPGLLIFS